MQITRIIGRVDASDTRRWNWRSLFGPVAVEVHTDAGLVGYGLGAGGVAALPIIHDHLLPGLVGANALAVEDRFDQMCRITRPYGRAGLAMMAISGVDLALWDLRGKHAGLPVCRLLRNPSGPADPPASLPVYLTAAQFPARAYPGVDRYKITMAPLIVGRTECGDDAVRRDVGILREWIGQLQPGQRWMLDAWCLWSVEHTLAVLESVDTSTMDWLEDPLDPDDIAGYRELRRRLPDVKIALGNFETSFMGFDRIFSEGVADIVQPDVGWVGGLTAAMRIAGQCDRHERQLILHRGGEAWGLALQAARGGPLAEFVLRTDSPQLCIEPMVTPAPCVRDGRLATLDVPGFGVRFSSDALVTMSA